MLACDATVSWVNGARASVAAVLCSIAAGTFSQSSSVSPSPGERVSSKVETVWRSATTASPAIEGKRSIRPTMRPATCSPSIWSGMIPCGPA